MTRRHRLGPLLLIVGAFILADVLFVAFLKLLALTVKAVAVIVGVAVGALLVAARRARQARHAV